MNEVKFNLKRGYRIGNYRVKRRLGSGCTAEAYLAVEVPTMVERVLKLYERFDDTQHIKNLRDFEHYCWTLAQLSNIQLLPMYHHMGHAFLNDGDGIGHFYMIQEYVKGSSFELKKCTEPMKEEFLRRVREVHQLGFALGDFSDLNVLVTKSSIRMVDCAYGQHNKPNVAILADLKAIKKLLSQVS